MIRRTFSIGCWSVWDDAIARATELFHGIYAVYPNILLANDVTLRRLDMIADKSRLKNDNGETAESGRHYQVDGFVADDFELDFRIYEKLEDGYFSLIFDSDPDDDGEPVPEDDTAFDVIMRTGTE